MRRGAGDDVRLEGLGRRRRRLGLFLFGRAGAEGPKDACNGRKFSSFRRGKHVTAWRRRTMTSCSVDDFFEKDARFAVVVETETKHPSLGGACPANVNPCLARVITLTRTYRSRKVVEKGLVLVVLEHLWDGEHPDDSVCLDVDKAEPVLFLQPETVYARTTVGRRNTRGESVAIASEDEDASEVRVRPVQVRVDERRIIHSDRSGGDHLLRAGLENR